MVIGERFVWAHFGKTGGDSVHEMFRVISRCILYADAVDMPEKHINFHKNEERLGYDLTYSRKRVMNIRRLPSWILSFVHHKYHFQAVPILKEALLNGKVFFENEDDGYAGFREVGIDHMLEEFMCGRIDYWLRTEYLAEDFIRVVSRFVPMTPSEKNQIRQIRMNVNPDYNKDIMASFSVDDLLMIYKNCPLWAGIEESTYGDILIERPIPKQG